MGVHFLFVFQTLKLHFTDPGALALRPVPNLTDMGLGYNKFHVCGTQLFVGLAYRLLADPGLSYRSQ